jgi:hypothetical protein
MFASLTIESALLAPTPKGNTMLEKDYSGSVTIAGSPKKMEIRGNPMGRTTIRLNGTTIYDKKPFIQKDTLAFDIAPGKPASLRWQQVSAFAYECDVTIDGRTTTLNPVQNGRAVAPIGQKKREEFKTRYAGFGLIFFGLVSLLVNYSDLQRGYYWTSLGCEPLLIACGALVILRPNLKISAEHSKWVWSVTVVANFIIGYFFRNWFIHTFLVR